MEDIKITNATMYMACGTPAAVLFCSPSLLSSSEVHNPDNPEKQHKVKEETHKNEQERILCPLLIKSGVNLCGHICCVRVCVYAVGGDSGFNHKEWLSVPVMHSVLHTEYFLRKGTD